MDSLSCWQAAAASEELQVHQGFFLGQAHRHGRRLLDRHGHRGVVHCEEILLLVRVHASRARGVGASRIAALLVGAPPLAGAPPCRVPAPRRRRGGRRCPSALSTMTMRSLKGCCTASRCRPHCPAGSADTRISAHRTHSRVFHPLSFSLALVCRFLQFAARTACPGRSCRR